MKTLPFIAFLLFVSVFAMPTTTTAQEPNNGAGSKDGDKCEVTSGPNKGKTGTFTDGATWCEGSWGGTECTDQQGNSKCKAVSLTHFPPGNVAVLNGYFEATQAGASPARLKAWETRFHATAVKKANGTLVIKLPNRTLTFDGDTKKLAGQLNRK